MLKLISNKLIRFTSVLTIFFTCIVYGETIPCNKLSPLEIAELSRNFNKIIETNVNSEQSTKVASRLLCAIESLTPQSQESYADDLHYIHQLFGKKAIAKGDTISASTELVKSLNDKFHYGVVSSFGPQTELASMLLAKGQKAAVSTYLKTAIFIEKEEKTKAQIKCALKDVQDGKNPFAKLYSPNFWFKICGR